MKLKNYVLGLLFCLAFSSHITAEEHDRSMALSISPVALIMGNADLLFQVRLTDFMALTVPAGFGYNWLLATFMGWFDKSSSGKISTTKAPISAEGGLGLRFTPFSRVFHDSFYLEPRLTAKYSQFEADLGSKKLGWQKVTLTPAVNFGFDWYYDSGFLLSLGAGVGYAVNLDSKEHHVPEALIEGFKTASRIWPTKIYGAEGQWVWDLEFKVGYSW